MRQSAGSSPAIQIQEPTLKEFKKRNGWLTGSCLTGSGCIVLFLGALYLIFRFLTGNNPAVLTRLPSDFPKDIPQPYSDNMIRIVEIDAGSKARALWVATTIPKLLASHVLVELNPDARITAKTDSLGRVSFERSLTREDYISYAKIPTGAEKTKTVSITWNGIQATHTAFIEKISRELNRSGYVTDIVESPNETELTFEKGSVTGILRAVDMNPQERGIEYAQLITNY